MTYPWDWYLVMAGAILVACGFVALIAKFVSSEKRTQDVQDAIDAPTLLDPDAKGYALDFSAGAQRRRNLR